MPTSDAAAKAPVTSAPPKFNPPPGATYALVVLFAINLINFYDRQILGAVGEGVRKEFGLTDMSLGMLNTVFTLVYAAVGLPLGRLSDKFERRKILAVGVSAWSILTGLSGAASTFTHLVIARLGVGVGEASCAPASTSLIGDIAPPNRRARATALWMLGLPLGLGLASLTGGWIYQNWGWRTAFYVAAVPGVFCAIAAIRMREPARGMLETHAVGSKCRPGNPYWLVLSTPTMLLVIMSGALHNFNMYSFGAFISPYLLRFHKMEPQYAGLAAAFIYGFPGIVGTMLGGYFGDRLSKKRTDGRLLVGCASIVIFAPLSYLALGRPSGDVLTFALLMGTGAGIMFAFYSTVYSTIHEVVEPGLRGTAMAIYFFAMYVMGASFGPVGTGFLSDYYTFQHAAAAGAIEPISVGAVWSAEVGALFGTAKGFPAALEPYKGAGLHSAMYVVTVLGTILAVVLFAASRTVKRDVEKLQAWMKSSKA